VRSLRPPYGLVQTLPLREVELLLATDAGLVAATTHSVYRLLPVPIGVQVYGTCISLVGSFCVCRFLAIWFGLMLGKCLQNPAA